MPDTRGDFLRRVREAVSQGNHPGEGAPIPPRGRIGYQGAGSDAVGRFREELTAAGGHFHAAENAADAGEIVSRLVTERSAKRVLLGRGRVIDQLNVSEMLVALGLEVHMVDKLPSDRSRDTFFQADIGISGVEYLIAETGTVAVFASRHEPRSLSLLPPIHIAIADRSQILADLFDLFEVAFGELGRPSCLSLITGPSKTGDIELRLVTGVHGPGELHVVCIASQKELSEMRGVPTRELGIVTQ